MKRNRTIIILLLAMCLYSSIVNAGTPLSRRRNFSPDSISSIPNQEMGRTMHHRMSTSAHPVQIQVLGRAVKISSNSSQLLPVYTSDGAFYMVMRLNKGVNWLAGLPRGRYFINNRPITIN